MARNIIIRGAAQHNLKDVDLDLPGGKLIVFSGVSGSGKSSLAFDTLYAEGQRRYLESLNSYARQFLGQMEKPAFTTLKGLSPTIAIEQKTALRNPRSTVGTITEILDYLRVLFARLGTQHCHGCGEVVSRLSAAEIVQKLRAIPEGTRYLLLAPVLRQQQGTFEELLGDLQAMGFARVKVDGKLHRLDELSALPEAIPHDLDIVVDRLIARPQQNARLADSVEVALKHGKGRVIIEPTKGEPAFSFSEQALCQSCGNEVPPLSPQLFSFNHPKGMCPGCNGLGIRLEPDLSAIIPDATKSLLEGAIATFGSIEKTTSIYHQWILSLAKSYGFNPNLPWNKLKEEHREMLLHGSGERQISVHMETSRGTTDMDVVFEGAIPTLRRRLKETKSEQMRKFYMGFLREALCSECDGKRLSVQARSVTLGAEKKNISTLLQMELDQLHPFLQQLHFKGAEAAVSTELMKELLSRLHFLIEVGVGYLSLNRTGPSLSGGEAQRIRLASQIGSNLSGVLYVLDEPSIGLHARDTTRLINMLLRLRDLGNTVLVVEHDENTLKSADYLVDFGPGAGSEGGEVLFSGDLSALEESETSLTGHYLFGKKNLPYPQRRRTQTKGNLSIINASANNLQNITVHIPLGVLVAVTGVSGAGKSTLINQILAPVLSNRLHRAKKRVAAHGEIQGIPLVDKLIQIDQNPIGKSPRSNPATYSKAFDLIRSVFANTKESKLRGYKVNRFSFNSKGGRCEVCQGQGYRTVEMHFLADVFVPCDVCEGSRFNEATLAVTYRGHTIADILKMTVEENYKLFRNHKKLANILGTLRDVGLGYLRLGQPANTLSGGESQRLKLASELARPSDGHTLYLLDEPTTGLHFEDVARLMVILQRLVDEGHSVLVVEHDLDVVRMADWVIDLGPGGGTLGGQLVVSGTPEQVAESAESVTGQCLREAGGRGLLQSKS